MPVELNWLNTKKFYKQLNYNYNVQFKPSANCRKEGRKMAIKRTSFFGERLAAQITEEMFLYIFFIFLYFIFACNNSKYVDVNLFPLMSCLDHIF